MSYVQVKVKEESDEKFSHQCRTCLSIGRRMVPAGEFLDTYRWLVSEYKFDASNYTNKLLLCWECHSVLTKIKRFQLQVQRANEMLSLGQSEMCSLSSLTTVILSSNEPNAVYVFDHTLVNNAEKSVSKTNNDSLENCFKTGNNFICGKEVVFKNKIDLIKNKEVSNKKTSNDITKRNNNKWAMKRAMLNKKNKFKLIVGIKQHWDIIFSKIKLDNVQIQKYLNDQRESADYKSKIFKCENCVVGFNEKENLMKHVSGCHAEDIGCYICDICNRRLMDRNKLSSHIQSHYIGYKCNVCNYVCHNKNRRLKHVATSHGKVLQCLKCELLFGSRQEFYKHHKEWHENFICDKCGMTFKMKYCIKDHIKKQHSPFECKPCEKQFARYNGLWLHNKVRHGPPSTAAYCVECDRRYPDRYRYGWHLANSARHRPRKKLRIPCPDCDKVFSKNIYMKDHYNLVHLKNFKYRCEECDKNFIRNADLKKHNRRVHEGILPPKNKICYMCGRGFTTNKILANHLRTHTGERPFPCTRCPSRFAQSAALASHIRSIHATDLEHNAALGSEK